MKKIAVFGANGNLGRMVVRAFNDAGWQVRAVTRNGGFDHIQGIEVVAADAMNEKQVIEASYGCDFIFNGINPLYTQWSKLCMPVARNMMAAAKTNGAVHLFPGNVYNYGSKMPATIGDSTPFNADTKKGKIRIEMETLFEKAAQEENVQTIVVRAGDFFGGTRNGGTWFDIAIIKDIEKGKMTYPGAMDIVHSWAYLPDLADTFVKLAERSESLDRFETFLFEGHAITGEQLKIALQNVIGQQLKHKNMGDDEINLAVFADVERGD